MLLKTAQYDLMLQTFPSFKTAAFSRVLLVFNFCFDFEMVHHAYDTNVESPPLNFLEKNIHQICMVASSIKVRAAETFHFRFPGWST